VLNDLGFLQSIFSSGEANIISPNKPLSSSHNLDEFLQTKSCIALPLKIGRKVFGVLDLHANETMLFTEDDLISMQLLANQIAVGLDNARLFAENQNNLNQLEEALATTTYEQWVKIIGGKTVSFKYTSAGFLETIPSSPKKTEANASESTQNANRMEIPISLRGQIIGKITLSRPQELSWLDSDRLFAMDIASKVALALENARLLEETQLHAAQEHVINDLTASFSRTINVDSLLQTAVRQMHQFPDVTDVSVVINTPGPTKAVSDPGEKK
jgi:transcriptional regulator with GAF, ATPase, and Fis domain